MNTLKALGASVLLTAASLSLFSLKVNADTLDDTAAANQGLKPGVTLSTTSKEALFNRSIHEVDGLFPRVKGSFVGDPMPMVNDGEYNVFYLNDVRGGSDIGVHAIHLLTTKDLYHYQNHSEILPYINDIEDPEMLLGTGSMIKVGDTWHAFYTAHNQNVFPVERVMHAVSKDRVHWTKEPSDTLLPGDEYSGLDFRDPHVVWIDEAQEYWMLVTTRNSGNGVIARYTSKDLKHWHDAGIFFTNDTFGSNNNLECPTLVEFNGLWYLSFSDQAPFRRTQFRVSDNPYGPWTNLKMNVVDGSGFYAGKLTKKDNRLLVFGWIPTRDNKSDKGDFDWAGNLAVHELVSRKDGSLKSVMPQETREIIAKSNDPLVQKNEFHAVRTTTQYGKLQSHLYHALPERSYMKAEIATPSSGMILSFGLNASNQDPETLHTKGIADAPLNVVFNKTNNKVYFFSEPLSSLNRKSAVSFIDVPLGDKVKLEVLVEDSIAVFYINNQIAFSTRMYGLKGNDWAISVPQRDDYQANVQVKAIK